MAAAGGSGAQRRARSAHARPRERDSAKRGRASAGGFLENPWRLEKAQRHDLRPTGALARARGLARDGAFEAFEPTRTSAAVATELSEGAAEPAAHSDGLAPFAAGLGADPRPTGCLCAAGFLETSTDWLRCAAGFLETSTDRPHVWHAEVQVARAGSEADTVLRSRVTPGLRVRV